MKKTLQILSLFILATIIISCKPGSEKTSVTTPQLIAPNLEQQKLFWTEHLEQTILKELTEVKTKFPEVNARYWENFQKITNRFGVQKVNFILNTNYHPIGSIVLAASGVTDGKPNVVLYIPSFMDMFERMRSGEHPKWNDAYKTHCLVLCIHEFDHLAHGVLGGTKIDTTEEAKVWAETVAHTIVPLMENYQQPVSGHEAKFYQAWLNAGRTNSLVWQQFIDSVHKGSTP